MYHMNQKLDAVYKMVKVKCCQFHCSDEHYLRIKKQHLVKNMNNLMKTQEAK